MRNNEKVSKEKGNTNIKQIVFPFGRAETEGFEPSCPGGQPDFESGALRPLRYVSMRIRISL